MDVKVIDNFLDAHAFNEVQKFILYNDKFEVFINTKVTFDEYSGKEEGMMKQEEDNWSFYFGHVFYVNNLPQSPYAKQLLDFFVPKFQSLGIFKSLLRAKLNLYTNTPEIKEHQPHTDYQFPHTSALFSLNTCDGFTRMNDGTKIDSVENRMVIFDGSILHNSSTTTNAKARYNINFNFL